MGYDASHMNPEVNLETRLDARVVLCTCPNREEAEAIALRLVERGLAACVNVAPGLRSIYRWQGRVVSEMEVLLVIKTSARLLEEVEGCIASLHTYETPEILALPVAAGAQSYLAWLAENLKSS